MKAVLVLVLLCACTPIKSYYRNAKIEDIKFCRLESHLVPRYDADFVYNDCMESLGYRE